MKITLYMATTIDGFIAKNNGDSNWVSPVDTQNFMAEIEKRGCLIVGKNTYKQFLNDLYPVKGVMNVVATTQPEPEGENAEDVHFISGTPADIIHFIESKGKQEALLIGGGTTNALFLQADLIDEIILSVHPITLGDGIPLFKGNEIHRYFNLVDVKRLNEGLVQIRYTVNR